MADSVSGKNRSGAFSGTIPASKLKHLEHLNSGYIIKSNK